MSVVVTPFEPSHLPAVRRLMDAAHRRPTADDYYRWAFLDNPAHRAWLALDGERCIAVLRALARPYRIDGLLVDCLETFDWYADPQSGRSAAGLRVMRAAMGGPEPLVNVGGTDDTLTILPKLGWRTIDTTTSYVMPLAAAGLPRRAVDWPRPRRLGARAAATITGRALPLLLRDRAPAQGRLLPLTCPGDEIIALYDAPDGYSVLPLPQPAHIRWLTSGFSGAGQFLGVYAVVAERLVGWGMARVVAGPVGPEAAIIDVYASRPTADTYAWITGGLVARLAPYRPVRIRAQATCPLFTESLRRLRFLRGARRPVFVWGHPGGASATPTHFTMSTQDFPMLPYAEHWDLIAQTNRETPSPLVMSKDAHAS